jgi:hypothetical protein
MYGLRNDIDLSFLNARELIQIAIGVYQIQFGFDEDVIIYVESQFNYFDGQEEWIWKPEPGAGANRSPHGVSPERHDTEFRPPGEWHANTHIFKWRATHYFRFEPGI